MPIYEYRCSSCGHEVEALQKLSEPPLTACPSCKTNALVKQVSAAGFQLKGSGWYATDFKGSNKPAAAAKPNGEAKPAGEKPATESKSESKAESPAPAAGCGGGCACH